METLLIIWLAMIGATVGSFLNVVIYRLPRGESIVSPPSHCPKCNHKIRPYDNLPILGWFFLGGKCRDCKLPISFRYPLVEILACVIVASFSALLFPVELTFIRPTFDAVTRTFSLVPMTLYEIFIRIFWLSALHLFLLTLGLMEFDRQTLPAKWLVIFLLPFLILGLYCPFLFPVSRFTYFFPFENFQKVFEGEIAKTIQYNMFLHRNDMLVGQLTGLIIGFIILWFMKKETNKTFWLTSSIAIGLFLGWQFALLILLGAFLLNSVVIFLTRKSYAVLSLATVSFFVNIAVLMAKW
jgi:prepilin signal peptidase PulO-like enzyme (type II secretory pathway)